MSHKMEMVLASCMFVLIVVIVLLMQRIPGEKITEETVETQPIELISGMPCEILLEVIELNTGSAYEQETGKEVESEVELFWMDASDTEAVEVDTIYSTEAVSYTLPMGSETQDNDEHKPTSEPIPEVDPHDLLKASLENAGIGWWYPYACAQAQLESSWNPNAVSPDGLDYGLFQFRLKSPDGTRMYWTEPESIFDVNAQIRVYTEHVAARLAAGLSIEETISRHLTSDYVTEINWDYVNAVLNCLE